MLSGHCVITRASALWLAFLSDASPVLIFFVVFSLSMFGSLYRRTDCI